jgi:hypothetical protein
MSFTLTEKAIIAIATLWLSFYSGQMSHSLSQSQLCLAPAPSTTLINPRHPDRL